VVIALAVATAVLPGNASPRTSQASTNVVVIPGFTAPVYPGFKGVPTFPTGAAQLSGYSFSQLAASAVSPAALQPYDTIILYGIRWATLSSQARAAINGFAHTGKVVIWDADATGGQDYSSFIHPFSTVATGESGLNHNGSAVSFVGGGDALASPNPSDPSYLDPSVLIASSHLVEDMSVLRPGAAEWTPSLIAANATLPTGGWLIAWGYGSTPDHTGAVIYSGMDADAFRDAGSPNYALKELALELAFPFQRSPASCAPTCPSGGGGTGSSGIGGTGSSGIGSPANPTFAQCSIASQPVRWVHGKVIYSLKLSVVSGIRAEIRTTGGTLVGSASQLSPTGKVQLPLNTRLLPTNRVSALNVILYVNNGKACTLPTTLKVDNTPPRILAKRLRRQGRRWRLTVRPSESVRFSIRSRGRLLRTAYLPRARLVSFLFPHARIPTAFVMRDRAGNMTTIRLRK
jgi:hypothetical protein